jgi:putative restriction endonuclease
VTTLLLGWSEAWSLFAAYDVSRHRTFSEASPSIQFRQDAIASAIATGMSFHRRSNGEVVVIFRPEFLMAYVTQARQLHGASAILVTRRERHLARVAATVDGGGVERPPDEQFEHRDPAIGSVSRIFRDAGFPARVCRAYSYACGACGLQYDIIEAAHIIPASVERNSSTRNGICLCPNHHRAFDDGLVIVAPDFRLSVDKALLTRFQRLHRDQGKELLLDSLFQFLRVPQNPLEQPAPNLLERRLGLARAMGSAS